MTTDPLIERDPVNSVLDGCGVLLVNMGGPNSLDEIEHYLFRLFSDPDMIHLFLGRLYQKRLARFIASRRAPRVRERYELIGGRSPLLEETRKQAEGLSALLGVPVEFGMRYSEPGIGDAIESIVEKGADRILVLPLYPQFSRTTSLSAVNEFERSNRFSCPYHIIRSHHDDPGYIEVLSGILEETLDRTDRDTPVHVMFTAHSIPESYVKKGDPYVAQTEETVALVSRKARLEIPWSLAYQSQIGPVRWQGPTLQEGLKEVRAGGAKQLVVFPVSFVCDNIETLYDLDIAFRSECREAGITAYYRAPVPGSSAAYLKALVNLIVSVSGEESFQYA